MGLRIRTNLGALRALLYLEEITGRSQRLTGQLASGLRIQSAADDPAGLGVAERLRIQARSLDAAGRNVNAGQALLGSAAVGARTILSLLQQLRDQILATGVRPTDGGSVRPWVDRPPSSAGGRPDDRPGQPTGAGGLPSEWRSILDEIDRVARSTRYNGKALLDGSNPTLALLVGPDASDPMTLRLEDLSRVGLGLRRLADLQPQVVEQRVSQAIEVTLGALGRFGTMANLLAQRERYLVGQSLQANLAQSSIRDLDVARASAEWASVRLRQALAVGALRTSLDQAGLALLLFPGVGSGEARGLGSGGRFPHPVQT